MMSTPGLAPSLRRNMSTWLLALAGLLAIGCKEEEAAAPTCVESACDAGKKACLGHGVASCSSDGKSYTYQACSAAEYCDENVCRPLACSFAGQTRCKDTRTLETCSADGTALDSTTCVENTETCKADACRPLPCKPGEVVCGFRSFATCEPDGTAWSTTACSDTEICIDGACTPQTCQPNLVKCKDGTTLTKCNADGTAWVDTVCPANQTCDSESLSCLPAVCTSPGTDGSDGADGLADVIVSDVEEDISVEPDIKPIGDIGLKPKEVAKVTVGGELVEFKSSLGAFLVAAAGNTPQTLLITMTSGLKKLEIRFEAIEEFQTGQFKDTEESEVSVRITYNDGTPLPPGADFHYQSVTYDAVLEDFQAKGGRVKGTFSGTITNDGGATTVPLEAGEFDIERE